MAAIDINRGTTGVNLPPAVSSEIWQSAIQSSAFMQLTQQIQLPGAGVTVDIITGDPTANWVNETEEKPVSRGTVSSKVLRGYTLAVIEPFSNQFRRDKGALYNALVARLPQALAVKFDRTVAGLDAAPGSDFDRLDGITAVDLTGGTGGNAYSGALAAEAAVSASGGSLSGWALSPQGKSLAMGAVDTLGRPLFISDLQNQGSVASILGSPVFTSKALYQAGTPATVGYAADWSYAAWGQVEGINISISDQATLTDGATSLNLWQRNMFAVRAEIEVGFRVRDKAAFVQLTDGAAA